MKRKLTALLVCTTIGYASACFYSDEPAAPPPAMVPASAGVYNTHQAATVLAEARCDREARCNSIGPPAHYSTRAHCMSVVHQDASRNFQGCGYGVKQRELFTCATEIRNAACGGLLGPLDWLEQSLVCRSANLCLH